MPSPRSWIVIALPALALCQTAHAQQPKTRSRIHNPISIVDTVDWLEAFGPGGSGVVQPNDGPTNYTLGTSSLVLGTGWPETYDWVEALPAPTQLVPLLVVFHKFGTSQKDMIVNTDFAAEAGRQGWYAVCPLAANTQHFASTVSQFHTEAVIQDMLLRFPLIDRNRIYAVGFSMGAGGVSNYVARHLDPAKPMLAAMITMSGGFALKDTYFNDPPARPFLDFWFGSGAAGSADPFRLARSSVLNYDQVTGAVFPDEDLARNLTHVPFQILRAFHEGVPYVPRQCDELAAHMPSLGVVPGPTFDYQIVPFGLEVYDHRWAMIDETWACNWLAQFSLTLPTTAKTLADQDGVYFHFYVEQDVANAFTPFEWSLDAPNNAFSLHRTSNLKRLAVDSLGAGLNTSLPLNVALSTADGLPDEVIFTGVPVAPSAVTRDGFATSSWSYNALAFELTLTELDGTPHDWLITP
jgi:pimeloyl-ACP methyl ester carboxylesterase